MTKPTTDELVHRVQALESAVDQMLGALKADLAALRADLVRLRASESSSRTASGSISAQPTRKISGSSQSVTEEAVRGAKKDPRSDE